MFDFSKRETSSKDDDFLSQDKSEAEGGFTKSQSKQTPEASSRGAGRREAAVIGPSIHIHGDLRGDEDLVIEGEVKGTVYLKNNSLTIGGQGKVTADVYAHTIYVDGFIQGDLYGSERINIRKSAQVQGNITSPRVSLEDGARFKGSVEMDTEALQKVFGDNQSASKTATSPSSAVSAKSTPSKQTPTPVTGFTGSSLGGKPDGGSVMAAKGESAG